MTADEIDKYINQIAFSGAEEFVKKYEGKEGAEQIIGHFGLGFYSAFMVADKVQIKTLSHTKGAKAVQWESNGDPEFTITEIDKAERGTEIVLHITKDSKEFLEKERIEGILNKYCKFLPVSILFGTKTEYIDSRESIYSVFVPNKMETGKNLQYLFKIPSIRSFSKNSFESLVM